MVKRYFDKFPTVSYNGYQATDITVSAKLTNKFTNAPYQFYRTTLNQDIRPEQVAAQYYNDSYMSWMVFYANKIVDPYYDWFLPSEQFNEFLIKKYGSIEYTEKRIFDFRINWETSEDELSPREFQDRFGDYTDPHSKYWNPIYNTDTNRVLYYVRKANDARVNTNKIAKVLISNTGSFAVGDLVDLKTATNGATVGTAEVLSVNTSTMFIKNVLGSIANNTYIVQDTDSTVYCQITDFNASQDFTANTWTVTNISDEEYVYWKPYTFFDREDQNNTAKRSIKLVDKSIAGIVADALEKELNG